MQPADIARVRTPSDPRVHPDGRRVAFAVARPDLERDRYEAQIWLWDGEEARPFTHGPSDRSPRWSPDGRWLAFLRKGEADDARPQVAVMPAAGGEARILTDVPLGVEELEWSPDSRRIVAVGVDWAPDVADLDDEERARRPKRVRRLSWRWDNRGWVADRHRHLYLVAADGAEDPRQLTSGEHDDQRPAWRPDGRAVAFVSARHPGHDLDPATQVFELDVDGGDDAPRALVEPGAWALVSYRPDGVPHLVGLPDPWAPPDNNVVWRLEADGTLTPLTAELDRDVLPFSPPIAPAGPQWVGDRFLVVVEDEGRFRVVAVGPDGAVEDVLGGDRAITGVSPTADGAAFAFVASDPTDPGELHWWEDGGERRLTALHAAFRDEVPLVAPRHFRYERDGAEIDAWVYLPPGDGPVPLLLNIHGGPATQYGWTFFDEFQVYAGAGYGVVATNPRGSSGYGSAHMRAVVGRWPEDEPPDLLDLRAAVDAALEREPRLDGDRVGIMGGSYGGYATARIIAADQRFASAVVERGLLSWVSFGGTSDIGPYFDRMYVGATLPDGFDELWRASPIAVAHRTTTPTLVLHSEHDFRCPIEQAEQYFTILRRHGVETELLRFPDESHELSRSGDPAHRVERFEAILDWHRRHLHLPA